MDQQDPFQHELDDWLEFCADEDGPTPRYFPRLFMELFLDPANSEKDRQRICKILEPIPNSAGVCRKLLQLEECWPDLSRQQIQQLILADLDNIRATVDGVDETLSRIDIQNVRFSATTEGFETVRHSPIFGQFCHRVANYFKKLVAANGDRRVRALSEAFYGVAGDLKLQDVLTAELLGVGDRFNNYFELYIAGVDYAIEKDGIVVAEWRKLME